MCLYPRLIKNRKYVANKKNGYNPPKAEDERVKWVAIGCGNCMECRKQKSRGWQVRLLEDLRKHKNGKFVTLTFSNESIKKIWEQEEHLQELSGYELDNAVATRATRLFLERWRKEYGKSLRHFFVTELGHNGTENIHLHGIVWTDEPMEQIEKIWTYGYVWKGKGDRRDNYVSERTVNYIIKYIHKQDEKHKEYKSIVLTSPGIGANYLERQDWIKNKYNGKDTIETYRTRQGHKIAMPIYWRNKIYSEKEREKLWLKKLDEGIRYICGEKVKESDTENYWRILRWHRERNKRMGYGDDEKNWEREQYERQRREMNWAKRLENTKNKEDGNNNVL